MVEVLAPLSMRRVHLSLNDKEKANLFNNYFASVCTTDNGDIPAVKKIVPDSVALDDIDFNRNVVLRALKKIKLSESSGPDNLPPVFFRKLSNVLAGPLSILFSSFMSSRYCSLALCQLDTVL